MFIWYPVPGLSVWTVIVFEIPSKYWSHWRTFWFGAPFRNKKVQRCVNDVEKHLIVNLLTNEAVTWCCLRWTRQPQTHLVQPTIYWGERYYLFAASWWWTSVLHFHMIVPIQLSVYIERWLLIVDGNYVSVMSVCMTVHGVWLKHIWKTDVWVEEEGDNVVVFFMAVLCRWWSFGFFPLSSQLFIPLSIKHKHSHQE